MEEKSLELIAAEWLVVGFVKSWSWQMLEIQIHQATGKKLESFNFFPCGRSNWMGSAPVRGYVSQNWPRLADYLDAASMEKKIATAKEIVRLKWKGELSTGSLSATERKEIHKTRKELRQATTSYRESRKNFQAHSKTQWGVCK